MVYRTSVSNPVERPRCRNMLNKRSVFVVLLLSTSFLVGISSVYRPVEAETQLLQPPLPGVVETQLLQPPLAPPPGVPPIQLPVLPPAQQQSSGGPIVR